MQKYVKVSGNFTITRSAHQMCLDLETDLPATELPHERQWS